MKQVVFILSYSNNQNAIKRIEEFQNHGITVKAYGFKRGSNSNIKVNSIFVHEIGIFNNSLSYYKRIPIIFRGVKSVIRKHRKENVLFYLFGLDVAAPFCVFAKEPFLYEEEDLIYTYFGCKILRSLFSFIDRYVVKNSVRTIFTSEGFANYHFGNSWPNNVSIIPNKLKKTVFEYPSLHKETDTDHLRFAFVGSFRFKSVYNFAKVILLNFPNHSVHFYGSATNRDDEELFNNLKQYKNCFFHGRFSNPVDLPSVYSQIDLLISTYDVNFINVKYAEPNKLYEAIYYETPIIVSSNCFLGNKVNKMGIGYAINAMNDKEIMNFVKSLDFESINKKIATIKSIDKNFAIDDNSELIDKIITENL